MVSENRMWNWLRTFLLGALVAYVLIQVMPTGLNVVRAETSPLLRVIHEENTKPQDVEQERLLSGKQGPASDAVANSAEHHATVPEYPTVERLEKDIKFLLKRFEEQEETILKMGAANRIPYPVSIIVENEMTHCEVHSTNKDVHKYCQHVHHKTDVGSMKTKKAQKYLVYWDLQEDAMLLVPVLTASESTVKWAVLFTTMKMALDIANAVATMGTNLPEAGINMLNSCKMVLQIQCSIATAMKIDEIVDVFVDSFSSTDDASETLSNEEIEEIRSGLKEYGEKYVEQYKLTMKDAAANHLLSNEEEENLRQQLVEANFFNVMEFGKMNNGTAFATHGWRKKDSEEYPSDWIVQYVGKSQSASKEDFEYMGVGLCKNSEFLSIPYKEMKTNDIEECKNLCLAYGNLCKGINFHQSAKKNNCRMMGKDIHIYDDDEYIYHGDTVRTVDSKGVGWECYARSTEATMTFIGFSKCQSDNQESMWKSGKNVMNTPYECMNKCQADKNCKGFSFFMKDRHKSAIFSDHFKENWTPSCTHYRDEVWTTEAKIVKEEICFAKSDESTTYWRQVEKVLESVTPENDVTLKNRRCRKKRLQTARWGITRKLRGSKNEGIQKEFMTSKHALCENDEDTVWTEVAQSDETHCKEVCEMDKKCTAYKYVAADKKVKKPSSCQTTKDKKVKLKYVAAERKDGETCAIACFGQSLVNKRWKWAIDHSDAHKYDKRINIVAEATRQLKYRKAIKTKQNMMKQNMMKPAVESGTSNVIHL